SYAYRINMIMLALVALFTGAFLVFSTQALAVARYRTSIAVLRVLGFTRTHVLGLVLGEGLVIGAIGAVLGIVLGIGCAWLGLRYLGGDLGAGYFEGAAPRLILEPWTLLVSAALGLAAAAFGALAPACAASRIAPASALKAGNDLAAPEVYTKPWIGLLVLFAGAGASFVPPIQTIPWFGYIAIAFVLSGMVMLMPWLAGTLIARLPRAGSASTLIAFAQLRATPNQTALSVSAILVSFSLVVAIATMVASFRTSLEHWLDQILPADLYVRAAYGGESSVLTLEEQQRILAVPGIARVQFQRNLEVALAPNKPPVVVIARPITAHNAARLLPLQGAALVSGFDAEPPVWISEAVHDLYGYRVGQRLELPLAGKRVAFTVAGVWRDYARRSGAIVMDRGLYTTLSRDARASFALLWSTPNVSPSTLAQTLRRHFDKGADLDIRTPGELRVKSLAVFDRSFALTRFVELVAVVIGLFGISSAFGAGVVLRRSEFGILRHIGLTRAGIGTLLGLEGGATGALGALVGMGTGWIISAILIHVVNRQSFHWSVDMDVPWCYLIGLAVVMVSATALTALWSGRRAMDTSMVRAVREDW
ncbi:MAG: FtsX-like permease family protein, partial [Burkholderiales bacterium]